MLKRWADSAISFVQDMWFQAVYVLRLVFVIWPQVAVAWVRAFIEARRQRKETIRTLMESVSWAGSSKKERKKYKKRLEKEVKAPKIEIKVSDFVYKPADTSQKDSEFLYLPAPENDNYASESDKDNDITIEFANPGVFSAPRVQRPASLLGATGKTSDRGQMPLSEATTLIAQDTETLLGNEVPAVFLSDKAAFIQPRLVSETTSDGMYTGYWHRCPFQLSDLETAMQLPLVRKQINTILEHLLTSRPSIQGPPNLTELIRRWVEVDQELISLGTRNLVHFISRLTTQLLTEGTVVLVKQRYRGRKAKTYTDPVTGRNKFPLWSYLLPSIHTVEVLLSKNAVPLKWRMRPELVQNNTKPPVWSADDVLVLRLPTHLNPQSFWGIPYIYPAVYAANILRDLQEALDIHTRSLVSFRFMCLVGSKDYRDGEVTQKTLRRVRDDLEQSAPGTTLVLPWFVTPSRVEVENYIDDLRKAAEYWELEIRRAIGGSMLQDGIGDSATRNTSDALIEMEMRTAQAIVPILQHAFRWLVYDKLWELGVDPSSITSLKDIPGLYFEEIDMTEQIRRETHATLLWQSDGLTHGEYRRAIGQSEDVKRQDKYWSELRQDDGSAAAAAVSSQAAPNGQARPKRPQK
ncbi:MAG: hypothetical protein D6800_06760 [Candidatus Zixiibacteriota bacterium]|nr:MAG: hypothetical protein D6800_06760 [candidate division Zixibacteria bacterium]